MTKVLFIVLPYVVDHIDATRPKIRSYLAFPYGVLSIATYCKDLAEFKVIDCDAIGNYRNEAIRNYREEIALVMREWQPDIVGFSMMFDNSYPALKELLGLVVGIDCDVITILGGTAATYSYEEILSEQGQLDAICYGEGELPFKELLMMKENWYYQLITDPIWKTRFPEDRQRTPRLYVVADLDKLIDIDYSFVDPSAYDMQQAFSPFAGHGKHRQFFLMTSRGCPFRCTFCSNAQIHGKKMRFASVDRIITHVRHLVNNLGMEVLTIYDDQLLINMDRAKDLFWKLAEFRLRVECPNGLSVRYIDQEMADLMREAGVDTTYLAIESGSPYVLEKLIKKPLKLSMVQPAVDALRKVEMFIHGFFVVGMPGETDEMRAETVRFIKEVDLDWAGFNPATPVRGSELYETCIKNGWIQKQRIGEIEDKRYIIKAPGVDPQHVIDEIHNMNMDVNFHNNRRMRIGDWGTAARCFEEVIRRYEGHEVAKRYLEECEERMGV